MNNDFTTTSPGGPSSDANAVNLTTTPEDASPQKRQTHHPVTKQNPYLSKRYECISALLEHVDVLVYMELYILYYMDTSLFRLLLRALPQAIFLTPKPKFVPPSPVHRPYVGAIFGPAMICILLHVFTARSEASEAMRGYLHGGIIIDLIGQKGPTSKTHLLVLDMMVLALQCFMLAVHVERERLNNTLKKGTAVDMVARTAERDPQDLDAEERGESRYTVAESNASQPEGSIEMQDLNAAAPSNARGWGQEDGPRYDRERLPAESERSGNRDEEDDLCDAFYSGTAVIAEFHILKTLKAQCDDYGNATASALQTVGFSAEYAAATSNRRLSERLLQHVGPHT